MARRAFRPAALAALLAVGLVAPVHAGPKDLRNEGCLAVGTHTAISTPAGSFQPHACHFVATGPVTYVASTSNPFVISYTRDDGDTWRDIFRRAVPGPPVQGTFSTLPGDFVTVSVSCWDYTRMTPCLDAIGGRYGAVFVHSRL